jgi:aspartyl-tRNA(Asn)/glutamyl-tRNA(Gln) amidotransferase subunit A
MHRKTLAELSTLLTSKQISSVELTKYFLERIERLNSTLNCFITLSPEMALRQANAADALRLQGQAGPLCGLPLAHKDIFCTQGIRTSCASKMLDNFIAPYDATVVEKLATAGMVTLGKTNMDEFAMGSSSETSFYGPTRNPWQTDYVPGGSSGGSAAAVAAGLVPCATGTDTGGSIRQPASLCGITGLKPTYGRVSRWGMIAFASSLDQGGPMTRSAEDAALLLQAMAGWDRRDSTSVDVPVPDYRQSLHDGLQGIRIGVPRSFLEAGLDAGVKQALEHALATYRHLGAELIDIELPNAHLAVPAYYVIAPAEASSNLSRYDGVRFGWRCEAPQNLEDLYKRTRAEGFGEEVKRRILVGTYVLSAGYYDAYYRKAQQVRRLIRDDYDTAFRSVDLILAPTSPSAGFRLGEKTTDPLSMYLADIYTIAVNLAGLPAMTIPAGFDAGLPVGLQLIGGAFQEGRLLNAAHQFQRATDWHKKLPDAFID